MLKMGSVCAVLILAAAAFSTAAEARGPGGGHSVGKMGSVGNVGRMGNVGHARQDGCCWPGRIGTLGGRGIYRGGVGPGRYAYSYGHRGYRYGHRYPGYGYPGYGYGYYGDYWPYVGWGVAAGALALSSQYYDYGYGYEQPAYYYYPPGRYRTWNGCQRGYTVQDGLCKPYRGY